VAKDSALNENLTQIYYAYQHIPPKNLKPPLPEGTEPFTNVESWPKFPGGDSALKAYINMHLRFPQENLRVRKEANVGIACIIDAKGKISDVHVFNGVGYGCDEEAIRLVKGMPDWIPARHKDIPVPVYFRMSVPFVLPKGL
jgi:protein TonB